MVDGPVKQPIVVSSAQGVTDLLQALLSFVVILATFLTGLATLIGKHDFVSLVTFVQTNLGQAVSAAFGIGGIVLFAWRMYKTYKRGAQLSSVAGDDRVPDRVAQLKK
jgi:hypothetical protein